MKMRAGCFCSDESADIYDANRSADLAAVRELMPGAEVWANDDTILFSLGGEWFGTIGRATRGDWFTRRPDE